MYPPMGASPPPGFLIREPDHHICADVGRLVLFYELAVTVINHNDELRLDLFHKSNQFSYLFYGKGGARLIPF